MRVEEEEDVELVGVLTCVFSIDRRPSPLLVFVFGVCVVRFGFFNRFAL